MPERSARISGASRRAAQPGREAIGKIKEGDIILLHDQYPSSVSAALEIVDRLQQEGYVFVTVEELLLD